MFTFSAQRHRRMVRANCVFVRGEERAGAKVTHVMPPEASLLDEPLGDDGADAKEEARVLRWATIGRWMRSALSVA